MRWSLAFVMALLAVFFALPIGTAAAKNKYQPVIALTEVSTSGGAVSATITNPNNVSGYLIVKTENEVATASLVVTVLNSTVLGDFLICTMTAVTTNTTTAALLGSTIAAGQGITDACDFPAGMQVKYTFTVSGAGADFDVTAEMQWVEN